jgi:hypothetical protein
MHLWQNTSSPRRASPRGNGVNHAGCRKIRTSNCPRN